MHAFPEGFRLSRQDTLSGMKTGSIPCIEGRRIPALSFMALAAALVYGVRCIGVPRSSLHESQHDSRSSL